MDFDRIKRCLARLTFREAVWLYPPAFVLHVLEEYPQFTSWARKYASDQFTRRDYVTIHAAGIAVALLFPLLLRFFPNRLTVFIFFAFVFTPSVFFNPFFHAGATAAFGVYCPGLITALIVYPPLFYFVSRRAYGEGLLTGVAGITAFVVAGVFHAAEVAHDVFKAY